MVENEFTSVLDKADWRKSIHKALENATFSIGRQEEFYYAVEVCIGALRGVYPNWNASKEIDEMVDRVNKKYNKFAEEWILEHPNEWAYPWNRETQKLKWKDNMYGEILKELKDFAGKNRMLLFGRKKTQSGDQMDLPGVDEEE